MMADVGKVRRLQTGGLKDGGYSSAFGLAMRVAISFSLIVSGWRLSGIGYQVPNNGQRPETQVRAKVAPVGLQECCGPPPVPAFSG